MKRLKLIILILVLTTFVVACADLQTPATDEQLPVDEAVPVEEAPPAEEAPAAEEAPPAEEDASETAVTTPTESTTGSLTGVIWNLTELNGSGLLPTTSITAEFSEDGMVGGTSGCNNYNAAYQVDGNNITIMPGAGTMMACPQPIMNQETDYLATLAAATTFEVSGDQLTLFDANGNPIAVYSAVSQDLAGTAWQVIGYNNGKEAVVSVIIDTEITLNFDEDGQLYGFASCNHYASTYTAVEDSISIDEIIQTAAICTDPEGIMEQETQYLAALETAVTYKIDGNSMNIRDADGATVANFQRMEPVAQGPGSFAILPSQISLDTQGLSDSWEAVVVTGTEYDESQPPGPTGLPNHIEILFDGSDPADRQPGDPVMYIIPANPYRKLWNDAGNDAVTRTMQEIQQLNFMLHNQATSGYPALPFEEIAGVNDLAVQVGKAISQAELNTTSATQDGYRFVGRWAQDANPVTNQNLRYTYQGFTNDGVYLVALWWPEAAATLPDDVSGVTAEQLDAFNADPTAAINSSAAELNTLSTDQWNPDIATLDALVASLQIEGMVASGLVDKTWLWTEGPAQPGSSEVVSIEDPSKYEVTYGSDGTMTYTADCNSGSMSYELNNAGMTGGMLAAPGPMTLAACEPGSFSDAFIASLEAAQTYQVWAGGNEMQLVLPAGGGVLTFRAADAPDTSESTASEVSGMVTNVDNAPIPEGATVSIQIQDTSLADVAAQVVGEQIIENAGQFPIAYQVAYDPNEIVDNHTYTMRARIEAADGTLLFINDTAIPVITKGNPTEDVEIPVIQVGAPTGGASVTGAVTFSEFTALPENATVTIQIQDTSLADVSANVVGEQVITTATGFPIPYAVSYNPGEIVDNHTYTMRARITDVEGTLLYINDTSIPVITGGNPTEDVEIPVIQVGAPAGGSATVSGAVTFSDFLALPENATVTIQIQDTSLADASATVIGEQVITTATGFPIPYAVSYDPNEIVDNHTYTMSARITAADGSLLFINDTAVPVITNGNPTEDVEIPVIQVAG